MDDIELTPEEEAAVERTIAEMEFYNKYKDFISEVKTVFLQNGPETAKSFIRSKTDDILTIACDELFWSLFHKL